MYKRQPLDHLEALRKMLAKRFLWSVLTCGYEAWTLGKIERRKLEAIEMWVWTKTTRTSWMDKESNEQVFAEVKKDRSLLKIIIKRKTNRSVTCYYTINS